MRPTRTPPPALPLALLAGLPLLLGCFDDELEPVDGLPEAIGPELPEGVSVGTDGSIVIDKGLAADGGDPLAMDGDDDAAAGAAAGSRAAGSIWTPWCTGGPR